MDLELSIHFNFSQQHIAPSCIKRANFTSFPSSFFALHNHCANLALWRSFPRERVSHSSDMSVHPSMLPFSFSLPLRVDFPDFEGRVDEHESFF